MVDQDHHLRSKGLAEITVEQGHHLRTEGFATTVEQDHHFRAQGLAEITVEQDHLSQIHSPVSRPANYTIRSDRSLKQTGILIHSILQVQSLVLIHCRTELMHCRVELIFKPQTSKFKSRDPDPLYDSADHESLMS